MADSTTEISVKFDSGDFLPRMEELTKRLEAAYDAHALRLECLKLAVKNGPCRSAEAQENEAQEYFDWVTKYALEFTKDAPPVNLAAIIEKARIGIIERNKYGAPTKLLAGDVVQCLTGKGWAWNEQWQCWEKGDVCIYTRDYIDFYAAKHGVGTEQWDRGCTFDEWVDFAERWFAPAPLDPPTAENLEGREIEPAIQKHRDAIQILFEAQQDFNGNSKGYHKLQCRIDYLEDQIEELEEQLERPKAQIVPEPTPEEVLAANGWEKEDEMYWRKGKIVVFYNMSGNWGIREDIDKITIPKFWDKSEPFLQWLAANLAALSKVEEVEKPQPQDPISFLKAVLPYFNEEGAKADGHGYTNFEWRGSMYKYDPNSQDIAFRHSKTILGSNDASILMTALIKLAAGKVDVKPKPQDFTPKIGETKAQQEDPEYILRENGWEWTSLKYAYEKKDSSWLIAPLPMGAWFACIHDEVTITMWILWKPNSKDSFAKYLQQF